ncbi:MAG TPA: L-aspartate oxidase [Desulfomicrobiaceae bacterium]|nr:L-aspartate oxidase [Desulfomicrobiaceae bacterium]
MATSRIKTQALVIGSGIAGCTAALNLAEQGIHTILLSAGKDLDDGNTALAQGGIVYRADNEPPQGLEEDIRIAGWGCNYDKAVHHLAAHGPDTVKEILLDELNIPFEHKDPAHYYLTREGGHSQPRILFCADYTGRAIQDGLMQAVRNRPEITILTRRSAIDLLTSRHHSTRREFTYQLKNQCVGAYVLNEQTNAVETILADFTVLATGGLGQIYLHTTNVAPSIGSGIAMGHRAGAQIMNTEYIQFHPTSLFHLGARKFLISEAVRGEGARLFNNNGERFMTRYDDRLELAPRDIVTRAIVEEMLVTGHDCVYLDAANYVQHDLRERFPTIAAKCTEIGVDITKAPIPVVPAAHYSCGGILVDTRGRTTLRGLYAGGECSCTGVHGANRLASTSLLEGLLWGRSIARDIGERIQLGHRVSREQFSAIPDWSPQGFKEDVDMALIAQDWATIRTTMWNYMGIVRSSSRLKRAFEDLRSMNKRLHDFYKQHRMSKPIVDLFHGCLTAYIVTTSALRNKESKGCHFRKE